MKSAILGFLLFYTSVGFAEQPACVIAEMVNDIPRNWQSKAINLDKPIELKTTDGFFAAKVTYQPEKELFALTLKSQNVETFGAFDPNAKSPFLALRIGGRLGQLNCWFSDETK